MNPLADAEIDGDLVLVPPGLYPLQFFDWTTVSFFRRQAKVELKFVIVEGVHCGRHLSRWYNAKKLKGKPRRHGRFVLGPSSDLVRDYAALIGEDFRLDRVALSRLKGLSLIGQVETVETDRRQRLIPLAVRYSTIRRLSLAS